MPKTPLPSVTGPELSALVGLSTRQISRLVNDQVIAREKRGRFSLEKAIPALIAYYRAGREGSGDIAEEKLRLTVAQRKEVEQRTAIKARELLPADEVRTKFDTAMTLVGSQLDGLGGRIANDVAAQSDPAICKQVIFNETRRIRTAAAAELEAFANHSGGREVAPAAKGNNGV